MPSLVPSSTVLTAYPSSRTWSAEPEKKICENEVSFKKLFEIELGKVQKGVFRRIDSTVNRGHGEDNEAEEERALPVHSHWSWGAEKFVITQLNLFSSTINQLLCYILFCFSVDLRKRWNPCMLRLRLVSFGSKWPFHSKFYLPFTIN